MNTQFYLKDSGTVFKGVGVTDIINQTDNVAGQITIRKVIQVGKHFMKLKREGIQIIANL